MLEPAPPLYHRLGGHDVIAAVVDDLLSRMLADPRVNYYWRGKSRDTLRRERQVMVEQVCAATGGPTYYTGREMKAAHAGLGITGTEWDIFMAHVQAALDNFSVPPHARDELLAIAQSLQGDIVEVPHQAAAGEPR